MGSPVIVDAVRTPVGKRGGSLSGWHPVDLAAEALRALASRNDFDLSLVDDVIMGCVTQVGAQSSNIARSAVLAAGWPETVPGTTVDRQCGSSQQALHFAAQGVAAGAYDIVIAAGVESMSTVPMFSNVDGNVGDPYGPAVLGRYAERRSFGHAGLVPQGIAAELVARDFGLTRDDLDEISLLSQTRAAAARDSGRFAAEIVPLTEKRRDRQTGEVTETARLVDSDECIRETTIEKLASLKPVFVEGGSLTAGNSSQISDGAAAVLLMTEERCAALGLTARARFRHGVVAAADPVTMLTAPIPATHKLLARSGLTIGDIDLFEINEAFAPVVLAWMAETSADPDRVNVNGGSIALGHPLGASGCRIAATLLAELDKRGGRYGLQTICEAGGMANAMLLERVD
jgi:acetyl-CoA acyltransferase